VEARRPRPIRQRDRLEQQDAGRVCAAPSCETKLSRYNAGEICSTHSERAEGSGTDALPRRTRLRGK
jgi:hypothetical protein